MSTVLLFLPALAVLLVGAIVCCLPLFLLQLYCIRRKNMTPLVIVVGVLFVLAALRMVHGS